MRDPARIERICRKIKDTWERYPDQRFGQYLENYIFGCDSGCIFYIEDVDIEKRLDCMIEEIEYGRQIRGIKKK